MTPATNNRRSVSDIVKAMKESVEATRWNDAPAFGSVNLFDSQTLVEAIQTLLAYDDRICVIIPLDEQFEAVTQGRELILKRSLPILILISDSNIGDRNKALFGSDENPGAYGLMELALPAVFGQLFDNPNGVVCTPTNDSVTDVMKENLAARAAIALTVTCTGGTLKTTLGSGPTV